MNGFWTEDGKFVTSKEGVDKMRDSLKNTGLFCHCGGPLFRVDNDMTKVLLGTTKDIICGECDRKKSYTGPKPE